MIEIIDDIRVLTRPRLELSELSLCGVPWASPATDFPRDRVVEVTLSSAARGLLFDRDNDRPKLYLDDRGEPVPLERVRDRVIEEGEGVLHLAECASFVIVAGAVSRFTVHGEALRGISDISDDRVLVQTFGQPDEFIETEAHGDLLFADLYYKRSSKWLRWDVRYKRLAFITLGGSRSDVGAGTFGSIVRRSRVD